MRPTTDDSQGTRRQRAVVASVLCLVLVAVLAIVLLNRNTAPSSAEPSDSPTSTAQGSSQSPTGNGQTPPPSSTSTASPSPTAPPAPPVMTQGSIDDDSAEKLVSAYVTAASEVSPDGGQVAQQVSAVAGDALIGELESRLLELESNGWTSSGVPRVVSATVIEQDDSADPPTATVEACIDASDVRVLDSAGDPLPSDTASARALNVYVINQQDDGSWILISHTFPDNPAC